MGRNKPQVLLELNAHKGTAPGSRVFGFFQQQVMVSYVPGKEKWYFSCPVFLTSRRMMGDLESHDDHRLQPGTS